MLLGFTFLQTQSNESNLSPIFWIFTLGLLLVLAIPIFYNLRKKKSQTNSQGNKLKKSDNNKIEEIQKTTDVHKLRNLLRYYSNGWLAFTRASNYKSDYTEFPNYKYIREIGEQAYKIGGISFMQTVCRNEMGGYLSDDWSDYFWQGLHDWQA